VTRAAKRAGERAGEFDAELEEAMGRTDLVSRIKVWTIDFTRRNGFLGIFLLASWPNAAFDMCGMACGWLEMPFWTFFGATLLGKSVVKTTLQTSVCIWLFSPYFFDRIVAALGAAEEALPAAIRLGVGARATTARAAIMRKFELQERLTLEGLLAGAAALTPQQLADKYCAVASQCGEKRVARGWSDADAAARALQTAQRVFGSLDADADGRLTPDELEAAVSTTDGRLSLGSLDPGDSGLLSPGNVWNGVIAALVLFFVVTIVEQVAKSKQAELDEAAQAKSR